jgi:hypothetical protein
MLVFTIPAGMVRHCFLVSFDDLAGPRWLLDSNAQKKDKNVRRNELYGKNFGACEKLPFYVVHYITGHFCRAPKSRGASRPLANGKSGVVVVDPGDGRVTIIPAPAFVH